MSRSPKLVEIEEEIEELKLMIALCNTRIDRLEARKARFSKDTKYGYYTHELAFYVERWMKQQGGTAFGLAEDAGISDKTVRNILAKTSELTREYIGDQLMTAMGLPHIDLERVPMQKAKPRDPPPSKYFEE
jgi:hypothetical protein